jgi:hypothetical protein
MVGSGFVLTHNSRMRDGAILAREAALAGLFSEECWQKACDPANS